MKKPRRSGACGCGVLRPVSADGDGREGHEVGIVGEVGKGGGGDGDHL